MVPDDPGMSSAQLAEAISEAARRAGMTVGVAESLTGGLLSNLLSRAPNASEWFRGGIVAYSPDVKQAVLGVTPGPVVTAQCAREMATGGARTLGVDIAVAVTGVGGPDPEEGQPPGTVWFALWDGGDLEAFQRHFPGDPAEVCQRTADEAMGAVLGALGAVRQGAS
jgi:nicotinamide-nucleotide amidase